MIQWHAGLSQEPRSDISLKVNISLIQLEGDEFTVILPFLVVIKSLLAAKTYQALYRIWEMKRLTHARSTNGVSTMRHYSVWSWESFKRIPNNSFRNSGGLISPLGRIKSISKQINK